MATILVADDEKAVRRYVVTLLDFRGHRILEAGDGEQALAAARAERPDLVITDLVMPVMDGYRFVKEMRNDPALTHIPVIFCSATYQDEKAKSLALACGVNKVLAKPCSPQVILDTVDEILGRPANADPAPPLANFDRDHLRLLTDTLTRKVTDLEQSAKHLQVLSRRLMEAQETERRQIAYELHDEVGQNLTVLKINLFKVGKQAGVEELLKESTAIVEQTLQQIRNLSLDLRPSLLDAAGLESALRWYLDRQAARTGLVIQFRAYSAEMRLPANLEIVCYRIVQEALTNILRHAHARRVDVELRWTDQAVTLVVRDDGVGFDVRAAQVGAQRGKSLGLLGMQERAQLASGEVEIVSTRSRGTEVRAHFPLPQKGTSHEETDEPDPSVAG